jgi:RNA polymerase sigma-70 factor (ECF subfamily)
VTRYVIVPADLAGLQDRLRGHFARSDVEVIAERRRAPGDGASSSTAVDRRGESLGSPGIPLPGWAQQHAGRLRLVTMAGLQSSAGEDEDTRSLVLRFQAGDLSAFDHVYRRYFARIYNYVRLAVGDAHAAEDITQQVFTRLLGALGEFRTDRREPLRALLFTMARNAAIDAMRKSNRATVVDPAVIAEINGTPPPAEDREEPELHRALEALGSSQRQVLFLRFVLDLPTDEVAQILDRSVDATRQLQARALRALRARMEPPGTRTAAPRLPARAVLRKAHVVRSRRFALLRPLLPVR